MRFGVIFNTKRAKQGVSCFPIYRLPPRYNGSAVIIADDPLPCAGQLSVVLRRRCALPFLRQSGLFLACPSLPDFVCHHRTSCGILHPDAEFWQRQRPLLFFRQRWLALLMIARHSVFRPTMASILVDTISASRVSSGSSTLMVFLAVSLAKMVFSTFFSVVVTGNAPFCN